MRDEVDLSFILKVIVGSRVTNLQVRTMTAPVDRVKLILQTQGANRHIVLTGRYYEGPRDCFRRIIHEEGVKGLWIGNFSNLVRFVPMQILTFWARDRLSDFRSERTKTNLGQVAKNFVLGGLSGAFALCFVYPLDFTRTRVAADIRVEFKGMVSCIVKIYNSDGFRGLYKGFGVSVIGIFTYRALHFGLYDTFNPRLIDPTPFKRSMLSASICLFSVFVSYPLDTIRRRINLEAGEQIRMYRGSLDCLVQTARHEGLKGVFGGYFIKASTLSLLSIAHILYNTPE